MGRRRKADVDAVVELSCGGHYATIIGYEPDKNPPKYEAVMTDALGRSPHGPKFWLDSSEFTTTGRISRPPGRRYRSFVKHGGEALLGCSCLCCGPHYAGFEDDPEE